MDTRQTISSAQLLSSFDLRGLPLRNRVVMAPLTRGRAGGERVPNDLMAEYYAQRASAGLIITEATVVSEQGIGWIDSPGIYNEAQQAGWKQIVDALHAKETPVFIQLWHCGRASHSAFHGGQPAVAPSAVRINGDYIHTPEGKLPHETPRALETAGIPAIVEDYRKAAERAKAAGFDGVEVHSANGYLLDQFLQSRTNQRTDEYGGSVENRFRLLKEVLEAVLTVWPAERVGVRLSPNGNFNDMGSPDYRETFFFAASQLDTLGLAYLHVVDGLAFGFHELGEPMQLSEFREVFHGPLMGNCGYTQEAAEAAVAGGHADLMAFGRPYLSNPDLVERFAHGWELNPPADLSVWSASGPKGYTDFPFHKACARGVDTGLRQATAEGLEEPLGRLARPAHQTISRLLLTGIPAGQLWMIVLACLGQALSEATGWFAVLPYEESGGLADPHLARAVGLLIAQVLFWTGVVTLVVARLCLVPNTPTGYGESQVRSPIVDAGRTCKFKLNHVDSVGLKTSK